MKAFKEWKQNATVDISNCKNGGDLMEVVMEETWRSCLKWTMRIGMYQYGNDFLCEMSDFSDELRKELGELNEEG